MSVNKQWLKVLCALAAPVAANPEDIELGDEEDLPEDDGGEEDVQMKPVPVRFVT